MEEYIKREIRNINKIIADNNYDDEKIKLFIEAKLMMASVIEDEIIIKACQEVLKERNLVLDEQ